jgi:hypothetical protein
MDPLKYSLSVQAQQQGRTNVFSFRDEHVAPMEYFDQAKHQPLKAPGRRNQPGLSGGVRGDQEPLKFRTKQLWTTDKGHVIPNSGFEIRKKIWYEGNREHDGGPKYDLFKMRVSKQPSQVAIDHHGSHASGPGGGGRKKHHLFVGVTGEGDSKRVVTSRTRQGIIDHFTPKRD